VARKTPLAFAIAALAVAPGCDRSADGFAVACTATPVGATYAAVDAHLSTFGAKPFEIMDGFAWRRSNVLKTKTDVCDIEFDRAGRVVRTAFFAATF
jgi:hypothetical protein